MNLFSKLSFRRSISDDSKIQDTALLLVVRFDSHFVILSSVDVYVCVGELVDLVVSSEGHGV